LALMIAVGAIVATSCSSGTLEAPAFKSSSALYQVTQLGSPLSSVEFTESGNYVIVRNVQPNYAAQNSSMNQADEVKELPSFLLASPWSKIVTRSTTYNNIITGTYTKSGETTYVLEGFGTVQVNAANGNTYSLVITETGASPYTLTAAKKEQYAGSEPTDKLCRTWKIKEMRMEVSLAGKAEGISFDVSIDEKVDGGNLSELMLKCYERIMRKLADQSGQGVTDEMIKSSIDEIREDAEKSYPSVESIIFTQAGTYMVTYSGNKLAISTWAWTGDDFKKIRYSWDYNKMNASLSGECSIEFDGKKCYLVEITDDFNRFADEGFGSGNGKMTYTLEAE